MEEGFSSVISGAIGAIAGLAGGFTTSWYQSRLSTKKETKEKRFQVYNKVLENDGIACVRKNVGAKIIMDIQEYCDKVRPHLFAGYHLLSDQMREHMTNIDDKIVTMNLAEDTFEEMQEYCAVQYMQLIALITNSYRIEVSESKQ